MPNDEPGIGWCIACCRAIAPSDARGNPLGPFGDGRARVLGPDEATGPQRMIAEKRGWQFRAFALWYRLRGRARNQVVLEISSVA